MDRLQSSFISIEQAKDAYLGNGKSKPQTGSVSDGTDFRSILENACGNDYSDSKVTFSKHANERLESRNINLSDDQLLEMITFANAAASLITTRKGALRVMPTREEVTAFIESRK